MDALPTLKGFRVQPFRRKKLKGYFAKYSKDNPSELWDDNVADVLEQQGFHAEKEPRSVYTVSKLFDALQEFSPDKAPFIKITPDVKAGIGFAYACFAKPKTLNYLPISDFTVSFIDSIVTKPKASAGLTAWGMTKQESMLRAYMRGIQVVKGEKSPDPCIALARTQKQGKTRLVWGYPFAMTALEGLFARPLIDTLKGGSYPMAFGMSRGMMGSKMRVASHQNNWAYSVDVHQFDASASSYLINVAFNIIRTWFDMSTIIPKFGCKAGYVFKIIQRYFVTTPIVMPDGNIYFGKRHGVPSGSYFTQLVDSIINTIYIGAIAHKFKMVINKDTVSVLGDDSLFWSNTDVSLKDIAAYASKEFDAVFQEAKSHKTWYTKPVRYLGTYWDYGKPTLPRQEIINKAVQPERFRRYSDDPVQRKREVSLLLMSYAAVYHNFFWTALGVLGYKLQWQSTMLSGFNKILGGGQGKVNSMYLSGYERYLMEHGEGAFSNHFSDPVVQMWK